MAKIMNFLNIGFLWPSLAGIVHKIVKSRFFVKNRYFRSKFDQILIPHFVKTRQLSTIWNHDFHDFGTPKCQNHEKMMIFHMSESKFVGPRPYFYFFDDFSLLDEHFHEKMMIFEKSSIFDILPYGGLRVSCFRKIMIFMIFRYFSKIFPKIIDFWKVSKKWNPSIPQNKNTTFFDVVFYENGGQKMTIFHRFFDENHHFHQNHDFDQNDMSILCLIDVFLKSSKSWFWRFQNPDFNPSSKSGHFFVPSISTPKLDTTFLNRFSKMDAKIMILMILDPKMTILRA